MIARSDVYFNIDKTISNTWKRDRGYGVSQHFQQYFCYIVASKHDSTSRSMTYDKDQESNSLIHLTDQCIYYLRPVIYYQMLP